MDLDSRRWGTWVALGTWLVVLFFLVFPSLYWNLGILEREATTFIRQYLDDRSVLEKVFDPRRNDFGNYQARELSYFIDLIDAHVYARLTRVGGDYFVPLSAIASSLLLAVVFFAGSRRTLVHLGAVLPLLLLMLLLTSFVFVSTMGTFYRSTKPLLAPLLLAAMFYVRWLNERRRGVPVQAPVLEHAVTRHTLVFFGLCLIMALLDRQGLFYVFAASLILSLHVLLRRRLLDLALAAVGAGAFAHCYNLYIGPRIILAVNGYRPSFSYQAIDYGRLLREPQLHDHAVSLLVDNTVAMLGGFPWSLYVVALVVLWVVSLLLHLSFRPFSLLEAGRAAVASGLPMAALYASIAVGLQLLMFSLMIARHAPVYDFLDHHFWYYPLPYLVTVLFGLGVLVNYFAKSAGIAAKVIIALILLSVASANLRNLDFYRGSFVDGQWFGVVCRQTTLLKASIHGAEPSRRLKRPYRRFYESHLAIRAVDAAASKSPKQEQNSY